MCSNSEYRAICLSAQSAGFKENNCVDWTDGQADSISRCWASFPCCYFRVRCLSLRRGAVRSVLSGLELHMHASCNRCYYLLIMSLFSSAFGLVTLGVFFKYITMRAAVHAQASWTAVIPQNVIQKQKCVKNVWNAMAV